MGPWSVVLGPFLCPVQRTGPTLGQILEIQWLGTWLVSTLCMDMMGASTGIVLKSYGCVKKGLGLLVSPVSLRSLTHNI